MKITEEQYDDIYEGGGYGTSSLSILLETTEGKKSVSFGGGEPEDFCLARDLSSAYDLRDLLVQAYNAGKSGEELEIELVDSTD